MKTLRATHASALPTTIGLELTFQPACDFAGLQPNRASSLFDEWCSIACSGMRDMVREMKDFPKVQSIGRDPRCVEIPTIPYSTKTKALKDIAVIRNVAALNGLQPVNHALCVGGGCHIHMGVQDAKDLRKLELAARFAAYAYPCLTYAFLGYTDSVGGVPAKISELENPEYLIAHIAVLRADIAQRVKDIHRIGGDWECVSDRRYRVSRIREVTEELMDYRGRWLRATKQRAKTVNHIKYTHYKMYSITWRENTMEFRCFRMCDTMAQHEAQIDFASAMFRHIVELSETIMEDTPLLCKAPKDYTYQEAVGQFYDLLKQFGLDPRRYAGDFKNMMRRYEHFNGSWGV